jgi:hypothetical protein
VEYISQLSFDEYSRMDLEELGKFFPMAANSLPPPQIEHRDFQTSLMPLSEHSEHFSNYETSIFVSLAMQEP